MTFPRLRPLGLLLGLALPLLAAPLEAQTKKAPQAPDVPTPRVIAYRWMSLEKWREFHQGDLDRAKAGPIDVLFLGDSITEAWDKAGLKVWNEAFEPMKAANFGIGGDTTQNVLWRITEGGALQGVHPKVVVLMIGTNNIGLHQHTPDAVARGVSAVVKTLRQKLPDSRILLLGIFPRGETPGDRYRQSVAAANERLAKIGAGDRHVRYLRIWDEFLRPDGTMSKDVMPDFLHPSEAGYRLWTQAMMPTLREMLGE
ncbi:MAG: GDSL family lipase [Verrucomicrobiae bacterium]|nr:GDSL family lipase [Verrucomicrobiae bacterium]